MSGSGTHVSGSATTTAAATTAAATIIGRADERTTDAATATTGAAEGNDRAEGPESFGGFWSRVQG